MTRRFWLSGFVVCFLAMCLLVPYDVSAYSVEVYKSAYPGLPINYWSSGKYYEGEFDINSQLDLSKYKINSGTVTFFLSDDYYDPYTTFINSYAEFDKVNKIIYYYTVNYKAYEQEQTRIELGSGVDVQLIDSWSTDVSNVRPMIYKGSKSEYVSVDGVTEKYTVKYYTTDTIWYQESKWNIITSLDEQKLLDLSTDGKLSYGVYALYKDMMYDGAKLTMEVTPISAPIPEPSTFILLGAGITGIGYYARRNRKSR